MKAALSVVQCSEIVDRYDGADVFRAERAITHLQDTLEERLRFIPAALCTVKKGEIVDCRESVTVLRP